MNAGKTVIEYLVEPSSPLDTKFLNFDNLVQRLCEKINIKTIFDQLKTWTMILCRNIRFYYMSLLLKTSFNKNELNDQRFLNYFQVDIWQFSPETVITTGLSCRPVPCPILFGRTEHIFEFQSCPVSGCKREGQESQTGQSENLCPTIYVRWFFTSLYSVDEKF